MTQSVPRAIAWLAAVFGGVVLAFVLFGNNSQGTYVVYAHFSDAGDLLPNNFVKIDSIEAGVVQNIRLNKAENQVIVKMVLNSSAAPIGAGASASVRPVNLLGEKYVQLDPGNLRHPMPSGSTIPLSRTSLPVELDDVFNMLDPDTRTGLSIIINEAGLAMAGQGANFMETLKDLPPTVGAAREVVGEIAQENQALQTAIVSGNQALSSVVGRRADLQDLIESGRDALQSIDTARVNLGRTLQDAPAGLAQLRQSLGQLNSAALALTPASQALTQATPALATTLERLPQFTTDASGALSEARTVAPLLARLGSESTPVLKQLRPAAASLATFASTSAPFMTTLDSGSGMKEFLGFVNGWADVTSEKDNLGHLFRLRVAVNPAFVDTLLDAYEADHPAKTKAKTRAAGVAAGLLPSLPASTNVPSPAAGAAGTISGVEQKLNGLLGSVVGGVGKSVSGITQGVSTITQGLTHGLSGSSGSTAPGSSPVGATRQLLKYLLGS